MEYLRERSTRSSVYVVMSGTAKVLGMSVGALIDVSFLAVSHSSTSKGSAELCFPVLIEVHPDVLFYVDNRRVTGTVALTRDDDARLFANGVQILGPLPADYNPEDRWPEEKIKASYERCNVTPALKLAERGMSWKEVKRRYGAERQRIVDLVESVLFKALDAGVVPDSAKKLALRAGYEADTLGIYKRPHGIGVSTYGVSSVDYVGFGKVMRLGDRRRSHVLPERDPAEYHEANLQSRASELIRLVGASDGAGLFVSVGGGYMRCSASAVLAQLDAARADPAHYVPGPLNRGKLKGILAAEGVNVQWE